MKQYAHEVCRERDINRPDNTVWPLMSTNGVDLDDCKRYLKDRGLSWELAEENGWYPSRDAGDRFLRIVIPALSTKAGHVYWQARAVSSNVHLRYQSPKGPRHGALVLVQANLISNSHSIYNRGSNKVVIVEGPMDALAVAHCRYDAVALMGIDPGQSALVHLAKLVDKRPALIVLDNEPAAQSSASLIAMGLASYGSKSHVANLYGCKDLAAMRSNNRQQWLDARMEEL